MINDATVKTVSNDRNNHNGRNGPITVETFVTVKNFSSGVLSWNRYWWFERLLRVLSKYWIILAKQLRGNRLHLLGVSFYCHFEDSDIKILDSNGFRIREILRFALYLAFYVCFIFEWFCLIIFPWNSFLDYCHLFCCLSWALFYSLIVFFPSSLALSLILL